jgi:hypothetical protein
MSGSTNTGEPFCFEMTTQNTAICMKNTPTKETIAVSVFEAVEIIYHKLDKVYLPDIVEGYDFQLLHKSDGVNSSYLDVGVDVEVGDVLKCVTPRVNGKNLDDEVGVYTSVNGIDRYEYLGFPIVKDGFGETPITEVELTVEITEEVTSIRVYENTTVYKREDITISVGEKVAMIEADLSKVQEEIEDLKENGTGTVVSSVEPMDDDIQKVYLMGSEFANMTTEKNEVNMELDYVSKTDKFHSYIKIKFQGTSSLSKPKKNFTIKLYSDEARETRKKKLFKDWKVEESKFVLKANYIDHTHARNIVCARLWNEVVTSRSDYDSLPVELKSSPRHGAIDGFPVKVYVNGIYQGIYTWNIGKDAWMWGMDEDNAKHVLLCAETNTNGTYRETPCNFRTLWGGKDGIDWSVEVGTNGTAVKDGLNALITCVKDTGDETFKSTIGNYLDIQSAIDYYIHQYVICG